MRLRSVDPLQVALYLGVAVAALLLARALYVGQGQHAVWSGPYFSGAANLDPLRPFDWRVCPDQIEEFRQKGRPEQDAFRFRPCDHAVSYGYAAPGFMWIVYGARKLLPWLADRPAVIALQLFAHLVTVAIVMRWLGDLRRQLFFVAAYALNPLVLYFAAHPYEYFWTSLAGLMCAASIVGRPPAAGRLAAMVAAGWLLVQVRPTVLPAVLLAVTYPFLSTRSARYAVAGLVLLALVFATPAPRKGLWHTAYVGIGAYPNPWMHGLSDQNGYATFARMTGEEIRVSTPTDNFYDPGTYRRYQFLLKGEYLRLARDRPALLLRNAGLNILQSFSIGHLAGRDVLNYLSAGLGALLLAALIWTRQYGFVLGIGAISAGFAAYYPPIPAYMFGAYLLLAMAGATLFGRVSRRGSVVIGSNIALHSRSSP